MSYLSPPGPEDTPAHPCHRILTLHFYLFLSGDRCIDQREMPLAQALTDIFLQAELLQRDGSVQETSSTSQPSRVSSTPDQW